MKTLLSAVVGATLALCAIESDAQTTAGERQVSLTIESKSLAEALDEWAQQSGYQIFVQDWALAKRLSARSLTGTFGARAALEKLLEGTPLTYDWLNDRAVSIYAGNARANLSPSQVPIQLGPNAWEPSRAPSARFLADAASASDDGARDLRPEGPGSARQRIRSQGIPEVLVEGSRILNMDIQRTKDDPQPYVVFEREAIEQSGAVDAQDFLKQRLPMNTQALTNNRVSSTAGNMSQINLRGLGANQTLVLIDGHRAASPITENGVQQADINGIPLAAIERIEILPTTASGIYGGSATGGVVNVVLRRDYTGVETKITYDNTFESDSAVRRADLSAGFSLEDGRTSVLAAFSYADSDELLVEDRDFLKRARQRILANNPSVYFSATRPPLGATANIRSVSGAPLFGPGTPNFTFVPVGYAGGGGLAPLQVNAGQYNLDIADAANVNEGGKAGLLGDTTVESFIGTIRRDFTESIQAFLEIAASNNTAAFSRAGTIQGPSQSGSTDSFSLPASAPNNPFGQAVQVTVPLVGNDNRTTGRNYDRRAVGGVIFKLPADWQGSADYTWNRSRSAYSHEHGFYSPAFQADITSGAIDILRDTNAFPIDGSPYFEAPVQTSPREATLKDAMLRTAGPIMDAPGGPVTLSALLERREENFGEHIEVVPGGITNVYPSRAQDVNSAYLEVRVPLFSARNAVPGVRELELQLAGRHDEYSVEGVTNVVAVGSPTPVARADNESSSTDPTFALRYQPVQDLALRVSYGTGFLPPSVQQLVPNPALGLPGFIFVDPSRGNTRPAGVVQFVNGGNPDLLPEESKSWSAGIVLTPRFVEGLRVSVDYTRIEKDDNIISLPAQFLIDNEALFPGRIGRGPVAPGDPFGVGAIISIDDTSVNIASAEVEAYDFAIDYRRDIGVLGRLDVFALGTRQTHYKTQLIPTSPEIENVGINGLIDSVPLKFKANAGVTWNFKQWTAGWLARYFGDYRVATPAQVLTQGGDGRVPSQTYHDLFATWSVDSAAAPGFLSGLEVQVGVRNVFNKEPPFDAANANLFNYFSQFGDPRLASYYVALKARF